MLIIDNSKEKCNVKYKKVNMQKVKRIEDIYAKNVFTKDVMKKMLRNKTYEKMLNVIENAEVLDIATSDEVANAMKEWAISKGATHYAHWFQPLNGKTAEKKDALLEVKSGRAVSMLLGFELIRSEPDASSFPSGGLRETFEARGYTSWDVTSPVFIKENTLYIPSVFYSYTGEVLDQKTPLLKSSEKLSKETIKLLKMLGYNDVRKVTFNVGAEQEYFLLDKNLYNKRFDLRFIGRTIIGKENIKSQEENAHYFGTMDERVIKFMEELDVELWKLGIPAKTKHNEVAPLQYELAVIYTDVNIAVDNNELIMEIMSKVANKNGFVCVLHEKPFKGINGSGKHNNWSIETDTGMNLFSPGKEPEKNYLFLLFLSAVIQAIDKYSNLICASVASLSNDLRFGGGEAPPNILSLFLGENITNILKDISIRKEKNQETKQEKQYINLGISRIDKLLKDNADRNRTSPFAFTGNKFEFRMIGSSKNISDSNVVLMLIMTDSIRDICKRIESYCVENKVKKCNGEIILKVISDIYLEHGKVIFNGDGYSKEWNEEAIKRNLYIMKNAYETIDAYIDKDVIKLFSSYQILNKKELMSKHKILKEKYITNLKLEANVLLELINKTIVPSINKYNKELLEVIEETSNVKEKEPMLVNVISGEHEISLLTDICKNLKMIREEVNELSLAIGSKVFKNEMIINLMLSIREKVDYLEGIIPRDVWPIPTYDDILYK